MYTAGHRIRGNHNISYPGRNNDDDDDDDAQFCQLLCSWWYKISYNSL